MASSGETWPLRTDPNLGPSSRQQQQSSGLSPDPRPTGPTIDWHRPCADWKDRQDAPRRPGGQRGERGSRRDGAPSRMKCTRLHSTASCPFTSSRAGKALDEAPSPQVDKELQVPSACKLLRNDFSRSGLARLQAGLSPSHVSAVMYPLLAAVGSRVRGPELSRPDSEQGEACGRDTGDAVSRQHEHKIRVRQASSGSWAPSGSWVPPAP